MDKPTLRVGERVLLRFKESGEEMELTVVRVANGRVYCQGVLGEAEFELDPEQTEVKWVMGGLEG